MGIVWEAYHKGGGPKLPWKHPKNTVDGSEIRLTSWSGWYLKSHDFSRASKTSQAGGLALGSLKHQQYHGPPRQQPPDVDHMFFMRGQWGSGEKFYPFCAKRKVIQRFAPQCRGIRGFQTVCFVKVCFAKLDPTCKRLPKSWWFVSCPDKIWTSCTIWCQEA